MGLNWTEEQDAQLVALHNNHISFREMAALLGGVSRNACIGRAHRLGLHRGPSYSPPRVVPEKKPQAERRVPAKQQFVFWGEPKKIPVAPLPAVQACITSIGIPFADLTDKNCHYPLDGEEGPVTLFCGDTAAPGRSYCLGHMTICYSVIGRR